MLKEYAQSVLELLKAGEKPEKVFRGLESVMKTRGHKRLYTRVLSSVARRLSARGNETEPVLVLASINDKRNYSMDIERALGELRTDGKMLKTVEDKTITGGFLLTHQGKLIDKSYKTKLLNWYRRATASK